MSRSKARSVLNVARHKRVSIRSISWRPNPAQMVCVGFDEDRVRKIIAEGLQIGRGTHFSIVLKDVSTIEGDPRRLTRWAEICREEIDKVC